MATPPTPIPSASAGPTPAPSGQGLRRGVWFVIGLVTLAIISFPAMLLIFFGLMPSIVALVIDRTEGRYATQAQQGEWQKRFAARMTFRRSMGAHGVTIGSTVSIRALTLDG